MITIQGGLRPTPEDPRDFQLGSIIDLPKLEELPREFVLTPLEIKDQGNTDFCSAFATCAMSELQENTILEPSFSFALGKIISGDLEEWGQDIRIALKAHVKYGALPKETAPYSLYTHPQDFLRNIANWPKKLLEDAVEHKKKTFFKVTGGYDDFDNIRATIFARKSAVGFGIVWGWPASQVIMDEPKTSGVGHMITAIGWKEIHGEPHIVIQNSYGTDAGEQGIHYFSRAVINDAVKRYGSYMFIDMDKDTAEWYTRNQIKLGDSWITRLYKIILGWFIRGAGITQ